MRKGVIEYSGLGAAPRQPREQRIKANEEKQKQKAILTDSAKLILDLIANERSKTADVRSFVTTLDTPEENVKADIVSRKLYLQYLTGLEQQVKNILSVKPVERQK